MNMATAALALAAAVSGTNVPANTNPITDLFKDMTFPGFIVGESSCYAPENAPAIETPSRELLIG